MDSELDRLKGAFLAIISHELRTPLTEIIAALDLLESGYAGTLDETQRSYIAVAGNAAERLNELISDLIAFAQLQAETVEARCEPTPVSDLVERVVEQYRPRAEAKGLVLLFLPGFRLPPLLIDRALMTRVVANLIINAITFTPEHGHVTVQITGEPNGQCVIIQDTGVGIPQAKQARLFESFYQADDHLTRQVQGLGIGLAYAQRIVKAHRGQITYSSTEGHGSTFYVHLPNS